MKKFLIGAAIFLVFMGIGGIYRLFWFRSHQIGIFERKFAYKDLADSKLGGKTPQETWNLYLDALEKGDVDLAVQYWVPEARERIKKNLLELKVNNLLLKSAKNHNRNIIENKASNKIINERVFFVKGIREKIIDYIGANEEMREYLEEYWKQHTGDKVETQEEIIFQLNSYTRKWLIRQ